MAMRALGSGGTALPGLVVERLHPDAVNRLAAGLASAALITGTNGKTTTAAMLARILRADGRTVVHNRAGSNLVRGVASALIESASPLGRLPNGTNAVLEADEAALPTIAAAAPPSVAVFTNLMRDQLDRYGEIESIARRWAAALPTFPPDTTIALNVDDPLIASLSHHWTGSSLSFGIEDPDIPSAPDGEIMDAVWDPDTDDDFRYSRRYFAQLGRWHTDSGARRPTPDIAADRITFGPGPTSFTLRLPQSSVNIALPAEGLYSVYNALAASAAATALGVSAETIRDGLQSHEAAFGRQEEMIVEGRRVRVLLGKNPSGMNQALRTLQRPGERHHLLILLNDGVADGTDVSWIWDVDWESQAQHCESLTVGGRRAADMALRLQYAGFPAPCSPIENDVGCALRAALDTVPDSGRLTILATYTAMLDVRQRLGQMGASRLWDVA
ncbi:MAG: MurT ligase domain-containing protein [Chloroflexota bacterium]|nr:MurT ligase domain-containing protein [Chloroflexota bacterium]MDE2894671.1 MurT ligase domain-containing protein [Chloroflexota bacterium]